MNIKEESRFKVLVEKKAPRGDLYELEQKTIYQVVDMHCNKVVMVFEELMEASLSRDDGQWGDTQFTGVKDILIADDDKTVSVRYHDGQENVIPLPQ